MNLASKREDSNRATSPHISRPSDPMGGFHRPLNRANHVTVSRGQVVPDSSRWSRGRGQVACNHLASRFIGGSLFLIPGKKRLRGFAITSQRIWLPDSSVGLFYKYQKKRRRGIAITSQRTCSVLLNAPVLHQP